MAKFIFTGQDRKKMPTRRDLTEVAEAGIPGFHSWDFAPFRGSPVDNRPLTTKYINKVDREIQRGKYDYKLHLKNGKGGIYRGGTFGYADIFC